MRGRMGRTNLNQAAQPLWLNAVRSLIQETFHGFKKAFNDRDHRTHLPVHHYTHDDATAFCMGCSLQLQRAYTKGNRQGKPTPGRRSPSFGQRQQRA